MNSDVVSRAPPHQLITTLCHELHHNSIHLPPDAGRGGGGGTNDVVPRATPQQHPLECDQLTTTLCHELHHNSIHLPPDVGGGGWGGGLMSRARCCSKQSSEILLQMKLNNQASQCCTSQSQLRQEPCMSAQPARASTGAELKRVQGLGFKA